MCAQDGLGGGNGQREDEMIYTPIEEDVSTEGPSENVETITSSADTAKVDLPRTTTGIIRIMRSKGRPEMANLVEELHEAQKKVEATTKRAEDLLQLLRALHRKATSTYPTVKRKLVEEDA